MTPGDVIADRFVIEELAGSGGMGTVYRALDRQSETRVAVKVLRAEAGHDERRFVREARILRELRHPRIVRHLSHGLCAGGVPYLVMEWVSGMTLSHRLRDGPLGVSASVSAALGVAQALAAAHARGIVHRDVKPNNLMCAGSDVGSIKLLDFGIARHTSVTHTETRGGTLLGTPGYLAPEQARGDRNVDARADIFSLGCVLFECLTGRPAFAAHHVMALLAKLIFEDAPHVNELCDDIPPALDELIARMLSKDASRRPSHATAVVSELESIQAAISRHGMGMPRSSRRRLTHHEQRLVSVVAAPCETHRTLEPSASPSDHVTSLGENLERLGTRLERLADGSLLCALTDQVATDLVARAARCALLLRDWFPGAPVVITTGRGIMAGRLPVGDAIDRAVSLLRTARETPQRASKPRTESIRLDELSAGLLGGSFEVGSDEQGLLLVRERDPIVTLRTLLGKITPCVGRDRELSFLEASFQECEAESAARVMLITGAPGLGKSRLLSEFVSRLSSRSPAPEIWLTRAHAVAIASPFALVGQLIRRAAGLRSGEPVSASRRKLLSRTRRFVPAEDAKRVAEFLSEMAGLPADPDADQALSAARRESSLMASQLERAWCDFIAAECRTKPLLLVLDDLHWGDLPSIKLLASALRQLAARPLMVLALARPSVHETFPALWAQEGIEELRLAALSVRASQRLVQAVLGSSASPEVVSEIVTRSDGNAFYLEELIRAVATGRTELPDTVLTMTEARLEALDPDARRVLRAASIFGEVFYRGGLLSLLGGKSAEAGLSESLSLLVSEELVLPRPTTRFAGENEYVFRHALVREAAYAALTERDRELGHRLAASWLEATGETDATLLAQHYERGGEPKSAVLWYRRAATQALEGTDLDLAIERAQRAMACGAEGEVLGELYIIEGEAQSWRGKNREAEQCGSRALPLLPPGGPAWCWGAGATFMLRTQLGDIPGAAQILQELSSVTPTPEAKMPYVKGCALAVGFLCYAGMYDLAKGFLERIDVLSSADDPDDALVSAWTNFARSYIVAFCEGRAYSYFECVHASLASFARAGDVRGQTAMEVSLGSSLRVLGQFTEAEQTLTHARRAAGELGVQLFAAAATLQLGVVRAEQGNFAAACQLLEEAALDFTAQGNHIFAGLSRAFLARALAGLGTLERAEHEAKAAAESLGPAPTFRAFALAVCAELELEHGRYPEALSLALEANELLSLLGTLAEGEALIRLTHARTLHAVGRSAEAHTALARARERLVLRAADIPSSELRALFYSEPSLNARTFALAEQWLGPLT